jgi:hypothetical protein
MRPEMLASVGSRGLGRRSVATAVVERAARCDSKGIAGRWRRWSGRRDTATGVPPHRRAAAECGGGAGSATWQWGHRRVTWRWSRAVATERGGGADGVT